MRTTDNDRPTNASPRGRYAAHDTTHDTARDLARAQGATDTPVADPADAARGGRRRTWPVVVVLTGLLGAVWAVAIASRYPNILPG